MNKGYRLLCAFFLIIGISGCSSVLTYLAPVETKMVDGEVFKGKTVNFDYDYTTRNDRLSFTKTKMCEKIVQKMAVSQKQRRGISLALLELPLFGLGLLDMLRSYAIVEESRKVKPVAKYTTGELVACDGKTVAANEIFIIRDNVRALNFTAKSDANGVVDLKTVLPKEIDAAALEIWPKENSADVITYAYPSKTFNNNGS